MKPMLLPQAYPGSSWAIATPAGLAAWFLLPEMVVIPSVKLSQTNDKHKMLICFLISGDLLLWQLPLSLWLFKSPLSMPLLDARNESLSFFSEVLPDPSFPPDSAQSWLAGSTLAVDHGLCPSDYAGLYSLEFMAHTFPEKYTSSRKGLNEAELQVLFFLPRLLRITTFFARKARFLRLRQNRKWLQTESWLSFLL